MSPSTKKFLYGLLYLALFSIIGFVVYVALSPRMPAPGLDFWEVDILDLQVQESEVFRLRSVAPAFLFARVFNPNADYGAERFSYEFQLFGSEGERLERVFGEASVLPREEMFLYEASVETLSRDVYEVRLHISDVEWAPASQFSEYVFSFPSEPRIEIDDAAKEMRVVGTVRNETTSRIAEARVLVALRDSFGFRVFVSGTILSNLRSFSNKEFTLSIPYDEDLARRVREGAAEVFFYPTL